MKGQCIINGHDMWEVWGATFCAGTYEAILTPAPNKAFIESKCRSEHGVKIVPNNPKVDERNLSISIMVEGATEKEYLERYESFVDELHKGLLEMKVTKLNRIFKFYYDGCQKYGDYGLKRGKFILKLREPNPNDRQIIA